MASIIPGYEYDIFISYRQKDNKHDGWVTEFVNNLKGELESTFKEEISVYFDVNPHDGLLETHDVNASLKEKLKCLVFIPIISRTYCDPKSFAWEHELKAFVGLASQDKFGLKVKLSGGNVANRILPIQIHDLDADDKTLLEKELGGILRPIEFIYKEPGVNKPLTSEDDEKKNLNNTKHRIQINKTANAIKEIISGLKTEATSLVKEKILSEESKSDVRFEDKRKDAVSKVLFSKKSKNWLIIMLSMVICIAGAFAIYKIIDRSKQTQDLANREKSIAVLPFVNDSPDKENEYFCNGMMDEILTQLQKVSDLRVKARTSVEKYRNPDKDIKDIGRELGVSLIIEGSVRKAGDDLRITAQLIDTKTGDHLWAEIYDGKYTSKIFEFQSNVAKKVAASLNAVITPQEQKRIDVKPTTEMLAHDLQMRGHEMIRKWRYTGDSINLKLAFNFLNQALKVDPQYIDAIDTKSMLFSEIGRYDSALFYIEKIKAIDPENIEIYNLKGLIYFYSNKPDSAFKYFFKSVKLAPNAPWINLAIGQLYIYNRNEITKGLSYYQKSIDLGGDSEPEINDNIADAYFSIDYYPKAEMYLKKALSIRSECNLIQRYNYILLNQGKYNEALNFLDSICDVNPCEQKCDIMRFYIYTTQKEFEKAEKYYNKAMDAGYKRDDKDDIYIACLYNETGRKKEAFSILNKSIKRDENALTGNIDLEESSIRNLRLAAAWAILDDNTKTLNYLSEFEKSMLSELACSIRTFPGFDKLRNNTEFKSIIKRIEDKKTTIRARVIKMEKLGELNM